MRKLILTALIAIVSISYAYADLPFRLHRFDSFRATPVNEQSIVFLGNSISNMHEWREAFGDNPNVINRGNSGATSLEILENIDPVIAGHPKKIFLMIGTNDLGSTDADIPKKVAGNIRAIIDRVHAESPQTELYVQSILPSTAGARTLERIDETNGLILAHCVETNTPYINLSEVLGAIPSDHSFSYDRLHPTAKAYTVWCNHIADKVGLPCTYPDTATATYSDAGFNNSFGMRITQWSVESVKPDDILFIGDEMIHGGEWHALLGNPSVKNRGTGWGYGGLPFAKWVDVIPAILTDNADRKSSPKQIFLYAGVTDAYNPEGFSAFAQNYQALIDTIRAAAPSTEINILSLIPRLNPDDNSKVTIPVNETLRALAASNDNVNFVDIYTPLSKPYDNRLADTTCLRDNYLYGRGYNRIAQVLAPLVGGHALSPEEFEANY